MAPARQRDINAGPATRNGVYYPQECIPHTDQQWMRLSRDPWGRYGIGSSGPESQFSVAESKSRSRFPVMDVCFVMAAHRHEGLVSRRTVINPGPCSLLPADQDPLYHGLSLIFEFRTVALFSARGSSGFLAIVIGPLTFIS